MAKLRPIGYSDDETCIIYVGRCEEERLKIACNFETETFTVLSNTISDKEILNNLFEKAKKLDFKPHKDIDTMLIEADIISLDKWLESRSLFNSKSTVSWPD